MRALSVLLVMCGAGCGTPHSAGAPPPGGPRPDVEVSVIVASAEDESDGTGDTQSTAPDDPMPSDWTASPDVDRRDKKPDTLPTPPPPPPQTIAELPAEEQKNLEDPARKRPKVQAAAVRATQGALDPEEVQRAVERSIDTFRPCLRVDTVVVLDARVTPEGMVTEATGVSSLPEDAVARDCVAFAFQKLSLGATGALEPSTFRLSLSLRRRG